MNWTNCTNVRSWIPVDEIAIQPESHIGTFFRMELGGEDIFMRDGTAKRHAVFRFTYHLFQTVRNDMKTVHEIKETVVGDTFP